VKKYLEARAKSSIDSSELKTIKKIEVTTPGNVVHPQLYNTLKSWRQAKGAEIHLPIYMILPQKTLMDVVAVLPSTPRDLERIKGFGKKKVKQFGSEILAMIREYKKDQNVESSPVESFHQPEEKTGVKPVKETKISTKQQSYELFKQGKTIDEIAAERSMAASTIEGHLAHYVGTGEIDILKLVDEEKIARITEYFSNNETSLLGPAKIALGDEVSWGELRIVMNYLVSKKTQEKDPDAK
jgi:ribonuclease D